MNKFLAAAAVSSLALSIGCAPGDGDGDGDTETLWYADTDEDGQGNPSTEISSVESPGSEYVENDTDCDDDNDTVYLGAAELCDGLDNACAGSVPTDETTDGDTDGYVLCSDWVGDVVGVDGGDDCNDADGAINPGTSEDNTDYDVDYNCDGAPTDAPYVIGDFGPAGGFVFYVGEPFGGGLEAAPEDQDDGTGAEWGCYSTTTSIEGADGVLLRSGAQNTVDMLDADCAPYTPGNDLAADLVAAYSLNGFNNWFLPSKDELYTMYQVYSYLRVVDPVHPFVGGFASSYYWSSSESSSSAALNMHVRIGTANIFPKFYEIKVRAVRAF